MESSQPNPAGLPRALEEGLIIAIQTNDLPHVRQLVSTLPPGKKLSPGCIIACLEPRSIPCFDILLAYDPSIINYEFDTTENTPLTSACFGSDPEMALWLLERGADPNKGTFIGGCSNLWVAIMGQPLSLIRRLIECGADVQGDARALDHAVKEGRTDVVAALKDAGAGVK
jgi:Ankyrin repeat